ncbi:Asp23/Gls24 family envelope stress response protein [Deinococcus roseus]|uniref:Asp23/Gls24 family envelope stress response protein n=1 Tax=Deinococcus roseus TaxID=392414 RepID=A0ABQ2CU88_9DEIO|nr:Asp23/Gls24 family envelope stress response protein [Deinococcus roseus]GGJ19918.1 hypothetical protein GCM10008938_02630 [Deinococcus roseus]
MKGNITITEGALAALIGLTAHEIPGVVGMSPANIRDGIRKILGRAQASEGVAIKKDSNGQYSAELFVIVAFGVNIPIVARNIEEKVKEFIKRNAGIELAGVTVHAVGVSHA